MSLIKCSECGKDYSDKATNCPNCGCSATTTVNQKKESIRTSQRKILVLSRILFMIAILGLVYGITRFTCKEMRKDVEGYEYWKKDEERYSEWSGKTEETATTLSDTVEYLEKEIAKRGIMGITACIGSGGLIYIGITLQKERKKVANS